MDKGTLDKALQDKPEAVEATTASLNKPAVLKIDYNKRMRVPKAYLDAKFSDLEGLGDKIAEMKEVMDGGESITLIGNPGTGKTHLAICLMRYRLATTCPKEVTMEFLSKAPIFVNIPDLLRSLKSSFSSDTVTEEDIIDKYTRPSLVVFDDLGVGNISDWTRDVYYSLIDCRMREEKQTIVTSNLDLEQIANKIDSRIASRLSGMGIVRTLGEEDYRLKGK